MHFECSNLQKSECIKWHADLFDISSLSPPYRIANRAKTCISQNQEWVSVPHIKDQPNTFCHTRRLPRRNSRFPQDKEPVHRSALYICSVSDDNFS